MRVKTRDGKYLEADGLLASDEKNDVAIIKCTAALAVTAELGDSDQVKPGQRVFVLGAPLGFLESTVTDGIVSAIRRPSSPGAAGSLLQITAAVSEGSSGGPVFNMSGQVVGLVKSLIKDGQSLNFAVPINLVKSLSIADKPRDFSTIARSPSTSTERPQSYRRGVALFEAGRVTEAVSLLEQAAREKPSDPSCHFMLGSLYGGLGRYDESARELQESVRLGPNDAIAHTSLGFVYGFLNRYQDATSEYKEAIRLKPDYAWAHYNLGTAFGRLGRYEDAVTELNEAVRLDPNDPDAHRNLSSMYGRLKQYDESIGEIKEAIRLRPTDPDLHLRLGSTFYILKRYGDSVAELKEAVRLKPDFPEAHCVLGDAYSGQDRDSDAIVEYKEAIRLKPEYAEAHAQLGAAYSSTKLYDQAVAELKEAVRLKPEYPRAHMGLGIIYLLRGDRAGALDEYKILKELDKDSAKILFDLIYP